MCMYLKGDVEWNRKIKWTEMACIDCYILFLLTGLGVPWRDAFLLPGSSGRELRHKVYPSVQHGNHAGCDWDAGGKVQTGYEDAVFSQILPLWGPRQWRWVIGSQMSSKWDFGTLLLINSEVLSQNIQKFGVGKIFWKVCERSLMFTK